MRTGADAGAGIGLSSVLVTQNATEIGAGEGDRTLDTELGKLVLYH